MRIGLIILALAFLGTKTWAQAPVNYSVESKKDSITRTRDSLQSKPFVPKARSSKVYVPDSTHSPHKAFIRSAILPGWGQVYNHKIWKVPIVYGGLITLAWVGAWNQTHYRNTLAEAKARRNGTVSTGPYAALPGTADNFFTYASGYQRDFQLCILGFVGVWGINCIDAYIDAKFIHSYSIDNNLSFRITPSVINQQTYAYNSVGNYLPALKLTLAFK